jgi:hypothetical protein
MVCGDHLEEVAYAARRIEVPWVDIGDLSTR